MDRATALAHLKSDLAARGVRLHAELPDRVPTGIPDLDSLAGGWPRPGLVEITGRLGAGRLGLVLPLLERETLAGRCVGLVDVLERLHPPGLGRVRLTQVLVVRPGGHRAVWAAEQMAASGALAVTLLLDPPPLGRAGIRLLRAAERGRSLVVVVGDSPDPGCPASLRLAVEPFSLPDGPPSPLVDLSVFPPVLPGSTLQVRILRRQGGAGEGMGLEGGHSSLHRVRLPHPTGTPPAPKR